MFLVGMILHHCYTVLAYGREKLTGNRSVNLSSLWRNLVHIPKLSFAIVIYSDNLVYRSRSYI